MLLLLTLLLLLCSYWRTYTGASWRLLKQPANFESSRPISSNTDLHPGGVCKVDFNRDNTSIGLKAHTIQQQGSVRHLNTNSNESSALQAHHLIHMIRGCLFTLIRAVNCDLCTYTFVLSFKAINIPDAACRILSLQ